MEAVGLGFGPRRRAGDARAQDEARAEVVAALGGAVGAAEVRHLKDKGQIEHTEFSEFVLYYTSMSNFFSPLFENRENIEQGDFQ